MLLIMTDHDCLYCGVINIFQPYGPVIVSRETNDGPVEELVGHNRIQPPACPDAPAEDGGCGIC